MSTFPDFSGIVQPALSQECGAYALAAALNQLGIYSPNTTINHVDLNKIDVSNPNNGYTSSAFITVANQLSPTQFANTLYGVTGSLNLNLDVGKATYVNTPNADKTQNPASALVYVAKKFGVRNIVVSYTESLRDEFQSIGVTNREPQEHDNLFMVEEKVVTSLGYQSRLISSTDYLYPTRANEVDIVLVNGGTHWVAIGWAGNANPDIVPLHNPISGIRARDAVGRGKAVRPKPILERVETEGIRKVYNPATGDIVTWEYNANFSTGCWIRLTH